MTVNELTDRRRISQRMTAAIRNPRRWYYTALRCFTANGRRHNRRVAADTKERNKPRAVPGRVRHGGRFFTPDGTTIVVRGGKGVYLDAAGALYDKMIYNDAGFDGQGYNRDGFDWGGVHRDGTQYDDNGYSWDGFDKDGFDRDGFDLDGRHRDGHDRRRHRNPKPTQNTPANTAEV